jgi:hypothetical protein
VAVRPEGASALVVAADYYPTLTRAGTLYFSSNRRGGLGQNDIYRVRRANGRWTASENIGPPVNTPGRTWTCPHRTYFLRVYTISIVFVSLPPRVSYHSIVRVSGDSRRITSRTLTRVAGATGSAISLRYVNALAPGS